METRENRKASDYTLLKTEKQKDLIKQARANAIVNSCQWGFASAKDFKLDPKSPYLCDVYAWAPHIPTRSMYCHLCDESFDFGEHFTWKWYNKLRKVFTEDYYFILTYALYTCKRGSYVSTKEAFIEKLDPRVKFSFAIYLTGKFAFTNVARNSIFSHYMENGAASCARYVNRMRMNRYCKQLTLFCSHMVHSESLARAPIDTSRPYCIREYFMKPIPTNKIELTKDERNQLTWIKKFKRNSLLSISGEQFATMEKLKNAYSVSTIFDMASLQESDIRRNIELYSKDGNKKRAVKAVLRRVEVVRQEMAEKLQCNPTDVFDFINEIEQRARDVAELNHSLQQIEDVYIETPAKDFMSSFGKMNDADKYNCPLISEKFISNFAISIAEKNRDAMEQFIMQRKSEIWKIDNTFASIKNTQICQYLDKKPEYFKAYESITTIFNEKNELIWFRMNMDGETNLELKVALKGLLKVQRILHNDPQWVPVEIYVDNCCKRGFGSMIEDVCGKKIPIKLDAFHWLKRWDECLFKLGTNTLAKLFKTTMSKALLVAIEKEVDGETKTIKVIPGPENLEQSVLTVFNIFEQNSPGVFKSIEGARKALENQLVHVRNGCLSDNPQIAYYYLARNGKINCKRGTNINENLHRILNDSLSNGVRYGVATSYYKILYVLYNNILSKNSDLENEQEKFDMNAILRDNDYDIFFKDVVRRDINPSLYEFGIRRINHSGSEETIQAHVSREREADGRTPSSREQTANLPSEASNSSLLDETVSQSSDISNFPKLYLVKGDGRCVFRSLIAGFFHYLLNVEETHLFTDYLSNFLKITLPEELLNLKKSSKLRRSSSGPILKFFYDLRVALIDYIEIEPFYFFVKHLPIDQEINRNQLLEYASDVYRVDSSGNIVLKESTGNEAVVNAYFSNIEKNELMKFEEHLPAIFWGCDMHINAFRLSLNSFFESCGKPNPDFQIHLFDAQLQNGVDVSNKAVRIFRNFPHLYPMSSLQMDIVYEKPYFTISKTGLHYQYVEITRSSKAKLDLGKTNYKITGETIPIVDFPNDYKSLTYRAERKVFWSCFRDFQRQYSTKRGPTKNEHWLKIQLMFNYYAVEERFCEIWVDGEKFAIPIHRKSVRHLKSFYEKYVRYLKDRDSIKIVVNKLNEENFTGDLSSYVTDLEDYGDDSPLILFEKELDSSLRTNNVLSGHIPLGYSGIQGVTTRTLVSQNEKSSIHAPYSVSNKYWNDINFRMVCMTCGIPKVKHNGNSGSKCDSICGGCNKKWTTHSLLLEDCCKKYQQDMRKQAIQNLEPKHFKNNHADKVDDFAGKKRIPDKEIKESSSKKSRLSGNSTRLIKTGKLNILTYEKCLSLHPKSTISCDELNFFYHESPNFRYIDTSCVELCHLAQNNYNLFFRGRGCAGYGSLCPNTQIQAKVFEVFFEDILLPKVNSVTDLRVSFIPSMYWTSYVKSKGDEGSIKCLTHAKLKFGKNWESSKIFDHDVIFIIVHKTLGSIDHYMLLAVFPKMRTIQFLDGIHISDQTFVYKSFEMCLRLVKQLARAYDNLLVNPRDWSFHQIQNTPMQPVGSVDCGIIVCIFASYIVCGQEIITDSASDNPRYFSHRYMNDSRYRLLVEMSKVASAQSRVQN